MSLKTIQIQGHRGERGNLPENTLEAFISAVDKGVDVIEMDVVISQDNQVVVSHEPFMSSLYVSDPSGDPITHKKERTYNLYQMPYSQIKQFDTGSRGNKKFPEQQKIKTFKPLLSEVIDQVEKHIKKNKLPDVKYNIEIKSVREAYGVSQPYPDFFVELVMTVIQDQMLENKTIIQSFDTNVLEIMHKKYSQITLAYLVEEGTFKDNLNHITFIPEIYSPNFKLLENRSDVQQIQDKNIRVIPWTVNKIVDIQKIISLGVDGIITDYPERVIKELKKEVS